MEVDDVEDIDGAADWPCAAAAEDGGLGFHVGGWDSGHEGAEG